MNPLDHIATAADHVWTDDRFAANLTAIGVGLSLVLIIWFLMKNLLTAGHQALRRLKQQSWVRETSDKVHEILMVWLWRLFVASSCSTIGIGLMYHVIGGDVGRDLQVAFQSMTRDRLLSAAQTLFFLVGVGLVTWIMLRSVKHLRPVAHDWTLHRVRIAFPNSEGIDSQSNSALIPQGVVLLDRYLQTATILFGLLMAGNILEIASVTTPPLGFVLRVSTILVLARVLTLCFRTFARPLIELGDKQFTQTWFVHYWERIGRLLPLGERCFEMTIWIVSAGLCVQQLEFIRFVSTYGEKLVLCIGIFFGTRVFIEFLQVLLHEFFGLYRVSPTTSQQARTLVPLLHSVGQYLAYFGGAVAMLKVFGFPTEPILAGAGVIGLAVGLGAQSLVTDVVSGLFILFENQYLVGDYVEIGRAKGVVEAVAVRHTQVRDDTGKLHLIPNGQIKEVINYSKGFIHATVDVSIPASADVNSFILAMQEAGVRLRREHADVLADTVIQGYVAMSATETTIRSVTRVRPGTHLRMESEYRRLLKSILDTNQAEQLVRKAA